MIFVDRAAVPPPPALVLPDGPGDRERRQALAFFRAQLRERRAPRARAAGSVKTRAKPARRSFPFAAYKHDDVRAALAALFGGKCAYCESVYSATSPVDIEHWRPKGAIIAADGTEIEIGYYWLAADWMNLLPSCADCNRERKQVLLPTGETRLSGKAERFPLEDETKRAKSAAQMAAEAPLLLNPCADRPEQHLEFFEKDGEKAIVRARPGSRRGETSIEVYGLNRKGLVEERRYHLAQTELALANLRLFVRAMNENSASALAAEFTTQFEATLSDLRRRRSARNRYAALSRLAIDPELTALGIPLDA